MAAIVFLVLLAGHLLGDWVAQTDYFDAAREDDQA
jgi:hypothetical protein